MAANDVVVARPDSSTLERVLDEMVKYGKPYLHCQDDKTWYCKIAVAVMGTGCTFEVASDFGQRTPLNAAQQCHERLKLAMKDVVVMIGERK